MQAFRDMKIWALATMLLVAFGSPSFAQQSPYTYEDDAWISIGGKVEEVAEDAFTLNYGMGLITVEMDDADRDADAYDLVRGDTVSVLGVIDRDFFENTKIEADSVYVEKLSTSFSASAADEEDSLRANTDPVTVADTRIYGRVAEVGETDFTLRAKQGVLTVTTEKMSYNPLDDEGYQKVEVGDRVSVKGRMTNDLLEGRTLAADTVVIFRKHQDARRQAATEENKAGEEQPVQNAAPQTPELELEADVDKGEEVEAEIETDDGVEADIEADLNVEADTEK